RLFSKPTLALTLSVLMLSPASVLPALADSEPQLNFKIYNPDNSMLGPIDESDSEAEPETESKSESDIGLKAEEPTLDEAKEEAPETAESEPTETEATDETASLDDTKDSADGKKSPQLLKGYVRVVPTGTKIPIIMDTAVDSDTSQEADEFSARTAEDLSIDGATVIPAGSIIKGRIAQLNSPRHMNRSGSVAMKFDTITTPDNRQIPIVANLVARGGVVHAKRGMKDIAIDTGAVALPTLVGLGIGALAGGGSNNNNDGSSSGMGRAGGAMIGAGVGLAVGIAILLSKKGKKVDLRPGDEFKIQLAEELRMPMM
ncbi:MAG TPA: TrbI/VirB10 family protein, partial [Candidatus Melainabacteria bacterium]|nr:TrbI/VirB10 family protein [Candidatus Melainabacteria bacterium]